MTQELKDLRYQKMSVTPEKIIKYHHKPDSRRGELDEIFIKNW
ncbi:MAG: hypothetical protein PVH84_02815 [Candidatus Aminicenantes bacterium]